MVSAASRGRERLAEWKALHVRRSENEPWCIEGSCLLDWPCPTALLIAALEEAMDYVDEEARSECYVMCGCQDAAIVTRDAVFAKLAETK